MEESGVSTSFFGGKRKESQFVMAIRNSLLKIGQRGVSGEKVHLFSSGGGRRRLVWSKINRIEFKANQSLVDSQWSMSTNQINHTGGSLFVFVNVAFGDVEQWKANGVLDQNGEVLDLGEYRRVVLQRQYIVLDRAPSFDHANISAGVLLACHAFARVPSY